LNTVQYFCLGASMNHHHQCFLCLLGHKLVSICRLLHKRLHYEFHVCVQVLSWKLWINNLQSHAGILRYLRSQGPGQENNLLDGLFCKWARRHHKIFLVEQGHPFHDIQTIKNFLPILRFQIGNRVSELGLRIS
jgi:hypothetical protein